MVAAVACYLSILYQRPLVHNRTIYLPNLLALFILFPAHPPSHSQFYLSLDPSRSLLFRLTFPILPFFVFVSLRIPTRIMRLSLYNVVHSRVHVR